MHKLPGQRYKMFNVNIRAEEHCIQLYDHHLAIEWGYVEVQHDLDKHALIGRGFVQVSGPPDDWPGWKKYEKPVKETQVANRNAG